MLNIRKRFFLLLTIVGLLFSLASCTKKNDYIEVKIEASEYVIVIGETIDVIPTVNKGESVNNVELVYVSQDDKIATYVDGKVTGVGEGQTVVKAYAAEKAIAYDTVLITVIQDRLPGMEFSGADGSIIKGETRQIECAFSPASAKADVALAYASSNPEVASVDENGLIAALKAGKTTITIVATNLLYEKETRTYEFELEVLESDFSINYELNGGQNAATNPAGYNVLNLPIALAEASKAGYTFAGWYDNAAFDGEPVTEIAANSRGDITLYAKWDIITYTVTYDLAGGEGAESNPATYTVLDAPYKLAEPTLYGYNFLGWYAGDEKVEELTLGNLELVAKWEFAEYTVSYDLNGGDWSLNPEELYEYGKDFSKLVADFVADFNAHSGKKVAADGSDFFARSWMADGSSAGYNFLVSDKYAAKWSWLLDLINDARVARGAAPLSSADGQAEARGEVHNFLNACAAGEKGGNASFGSNYTGIDTSNAVWGKLLKIDIVNSYNMNSETFEIPTPVKLGQEFLGWFDAEGNKVEKVEKGSTGNLELTAKWELDEYSITYNYNGGLLDIYKYASRDALVADFLADYNTARNKSHTVASFAALGSWGEISDASLFLYNETYRAKWAWLVDYIASVAGSANKKAWEAFNNYNSQKELNAANSNYIYSIAYELRGFVGGIQYSKNKNYVTADYSQEAIGNGFWDLLVREDAKLPVISYVYTDAVIELPAPIKANDTFLGWYLDGEKVTSIDPAIAKDVVLEARWANDEYAINYELNEGALAESDPKSFTTGAGLETLPTPTRIGYTFTGWYSDAALTKKVENIPAGLMEEVTLYAGWEIVTYKVNYELNGGAFIRDEIVDEYDSYEAFVNEFINDYSALTGVAGITPANFYGKTVKYGLYSFFINEEMAAKWNWVLEFVAAKAEEVGYAGKAYLNVSAGAANFNKYARSNFAALLQQSMITNISPISMNFKEVDGEEFWAACPDKTIQVGTESKESFTVLELPFAIATPDKKGASFVGWYTNSDLKNGKVTEVTIDMVGDVTLYARWSDSVIKFDTYNITYELNGGTLEEGAPATYVEETGVALSKGATRDGYAFKGWFLDEACTTQVKEFTALDKGDKTVYALWEAIEYVITYNPGEGSVPTTEVLVGGYESWADMVADFIKDFNAHAGKTAAADGSDFFARSYMGDGSSAGYKFLTSEAYKDKWATILTVINETRVARGAEELKDSDGQAEARGEVQNLLTKSSAAAGVTAGYGSDYTSEEVWGKVWEAYKAVYEEVAAPTTYTVEDLPYQLIIPTAPADKEFAGWFDNAELTGEAVYELPVGTLGNKEFWAKYIDARYDITYELNGGTNSDSNPARYGRDEEIILSDPLKEGYTFLGWELNGEKIDKIAVGTTGNLTLVATWEINVYDIVLDDGNLQESSPIVAYGDELVNDFNKESEGYSDAEVTVKETFRDTSHPNIKYVFDSTEMLEKYHALLEFALAEITASATANGKAEHDYFLNVKEMLERMINSDTTAISDSSYSQGRTLFRWWIQCLINQNLASTTYYDHFMTDYSVKENIERAYAALDLSTNGAQKFEHGAVLPEPAKEHYVFVGWFDGENKVENATYSCTLVAKWETVKYEVILDAQGGMLGEGLTLESFTEELIKDFNSTGASDAVVTTKENFQGSSHPNIKYVWNNEANLAKYKWFFEFALAEMKAAAEANGKTNETRYTNTVEMLEGLIAGNTATIGGSYAEGRTALRCFIEGLINEKLPAGNTNYPFMVDYSVAENKARFEEAIANAAPVENEFCAKDTLPTPVREGHLFLGWYIGEELVTAVRSNCTLVAKWVDTATLKYTISYDAQEGTLPEDAVVEFGYNEAVVLPVPTREGYKFLGWYEGETLVEKLENRNYELVAKWEAETAKEINYVLDGGTLPEDAPKDFLLGVGLETLPTPTRNGYEFLGWFTDEACTKAITSIPAEETEAVTLYAAWNKLDIPAKELVVDPTNPDAYATYAEAEAAALDGDTILFASGVYEDAIEITKSIKLYGANHGVNPNDGERTGESLFTANIVLSADYITIDGIALTGLGHIVANREKSLKNPIITNVYSFESAINPESSYSADAPICFYSETAGVVYEDIELINLKYANSSGRPMVFYGAQIDGFKVLNCNFNCIGGNYNDAIKITDDDKDPAAKPQFGIRGDVLIVGNHFENYQQYVLWFISYQEGNYEIYNNTFKNCGQSESSHCAVRFQEYSGASDGKVDINFSYNTVDNAYSLFRLDVSSEGYTTKTAQNHSAIVNYNKSVNSLATYYVNNKTDINIDATNNWYDVTPVESKFKGATWNPYIQNEDELPKYVDNDNSVLINYELNGGQLPEGAELYYNTLTGLSSLPVPTYDKHVFMGWLYEGQSVTSLEKGIEGDVELVATWREDALYVGEGDADYIYATLAEAIAAAEAGDKIILMAGEHTGDVTISIADLVIAGPNQGINPNTGERATEAVYTGTITLAQGADNLTVDGIAFTGAAHIVSTNKVAYAGFTFKNNYVYDTDASSTDWVVGRYLMAAFIEFRQNNSGIPSNVQILNNKFVNVDAVNVMVNRAHNLSVDGNVFKDFGQDAIRVEGGYADGDISFTNNTFEQSVAGSAYNGLFIYSISGSSKTTVVVKNNLFKNLGQDLSASNNVKYSGAISTHFFQEQPTEWFISNNIFDHCYNYISIRNNGGNASTFAATIENNQFLGLPADYYHSSYIGTDTETSNPHLTVFKANYYEDNNGNVITDLTQYADKFLHLASYGTALSAKPGEVEVEALEFYTISYELNGGSTRDEFVYNYSSNRNAVITLPELTKANHQFNGWLLNGELVKEIAVGVKGNLEIVADFTVLEGEIYNLEFVANKEDAVWPTRAAYDRQEILDSLYADLYKWAQGNGETKSYDEYVTYIVEQINAFKDIKLYNTTLLKYPAEDGSTEHFLNIPEYNQKWIPFFTIFDEGVHAQNSSQYFFESSTYVAMVRLRDFIAWNATAQKCFSTRLTAMYEAARIPEEIPTTYRGGQIITLPVLTMNNGLEFLGWYDNAEFTGTPVTQITATDTGDKKFYAKWAEEVKPESITINSINELLLFTSHQLVWSILPENTTDKSVEFFSSDESVATVSTKGLIEAHKLGTTTITVKVYGNRELDIKFDLTVFVNDYIDGSYYSNSYVEKDDSIQLNAEVVHKDLTKGAVKWSSLNPEIATVDENGVVKGVAAGLATIVAEDPNNADNKLEFVVTVIEEAAEGVLDFILRSNNSNIFVEYQLSIGGDYNADIFGSVSKLLHNHKLEINTDYLENGNATNDYYNNSNNLYGLEFITVHYTAGFPASADTDNHASYFTTGSADVSIHYITGNKGTSNGQPTSEVYNTLDHAHGAWHAGDSNARYYSNSTKKNEAGELVFTWMPTGVMYDDVDLMDVKFSASDDFYFEINGKKTSIKLPTTYNYNSRGTDHIYNADGTISSQSNYTGAAIVNAPVEDYFNDQSLPVTVIDGEYYMGPTWWSYGQTTTGLICGSGGNMNSIGIESCVNKGSDLWYTWQVTAKLVAKLMDENDLAISRVKGHHFFDGKNCPQPMLENDLEIWWEFLDLVEAEYELRTNYSDYEITIKSNNPEIVNDNGRVIVQPTETTCVTYTVTITKGEETQTVTLASMIQGLYVGR